LPSETQAIPQPPWPHSALLEHGEFAWTDGRITENPRHGAISRQRFEIADVIFAEVQERKRIDCLAKIMKRGRPECPGVPALPAIKHHAPPVRGGEYGAMAVAYVKNLNLHGGHLIQANLL
jgi:hypothetical protein